MTNLTHIFCFLLSNNTLSHFTSLRSEFPSTWAIQVMGCAYLQQCLMVVVAVTEVDEIAAFVNPQYAFVAKVKLCVSCFSTS